MRVPGHVGVPAAVSEAGCSRTTGLSSSHALFPTSRASNRRSSSHSRRAQAPQPRRKGTTTTYTTQATTASLPWLHALEPALPWRTERACWRSTRSWAGVISAGCGPAWGCAGLTSARRWDFVRASRTISHKYQPLLLPSFTGFCGAGTLVLRCAACWWLAVAQCGWEATTAPSASCTERPVPSRGGGR